MDPTGAGYHLLLTDGIPQTERFACAPPEESFGGETVILSPGVAETFKASFWHAYLARNSPPRRAAFRTQDW